MADEIRLTVSPEPRPDYLFVSADGELTAQSVPLLGASLRRLCEEAGVGGVVVDARGFTGALSTTELYYATPQFVKGLGPVKVAYINPPPHWMPGDDQFSRDVAHNSGGFLELFSSESEAAEWLRDQKRNGN